MASKNKLKKLTKYVIFSLLMVLIYTIVVTVLTAVTDKDYSTLYVTFCGIFGSELLCTMLIKIFNLKKEDGYSEQ